MINIKILQKFVTVMAVIDECDILNNNDKIKIINMLGQCIRDHLDGIKYTVNIDGKEYPILEQCDIVKYPDGEISRVKTITAYKNRVGVPLKTAVAVYNKTYTNF